MIFLTKRENKMTKEEILNNKYLKWLKPYAAKDWLWKNKKKEIAKGAAIGIMFGLLIPIAQIPLSIIFCILLRGNIAFAALFTLITNPITFAPVYAIAYQIGNYIMNTFNIEEINAENINGYLGAFLEAGQPTIIGLWSLALILVPLTYYGMLLFWKYKAFKRLKRMNLKIKI